MRWHQKGYRLDGLRRPYAQTKRNQAAYVCSRTLCALGYCHVMARAAGWRRVVSGQPCMPQHAHAPSLPASSLPLLGICTNVHCMYVARPVYQCTLVSTVLLACVYIPTLSKCTSRYRITLMHGFLAPQVEVPRDQSAAEMAMSPVASVSSHVDPYPHYIMAGASEYSLSCRWGRTSMQLS